MPKAKTTKTTKAKATTAKPKKETKGNGKAKPLPAQHRLPLAFATINVNLSEKELSDMKDALISLHVTIDAKAEQLAAHNKKTKGEIAELMDRQKQLYTACRTKRETRSVNDAVQVYNPATKEAWVEHNGKIYEKRDMSADEILHCKNKPLFDETGKPMPKVNQTPADKPPKETKTATEKEATDTKVEAAIANLANVAREEGKPGKRTPRTPAQMRGRL